MHDPITEVDCAVAMRRTPIDPWSDFTPGRWLWFLAGTEVLPEPVPAVGPQFFWQWALVIAVRHLDYSLALNREQVAAATMSGSQAIDQGRYS